MNLIDILRDWTEQEPGSVLLAAFTTFLVISLFPLLPDLLAAFRKWRAEGVEAANKAITEPAKRLRELKKVTEKGLLSILVVIVQLPLTSAVWASSDLAREELVRQELAQGFWGTIIAIAAAVAIVFLVWPLLFYLLLKRREKEEAERNLYKGGMWN